MVVVRGLICQSLVKTRQLVALRDSSMRRMVSSSKYFTDGLSQCEISTFRSESHLVVWILSKRSNAIKHAVARQPARIRTLV